LLAIFAIRAFGGEVGSINVGLVFDNPRTACTTRNYGFDNGYNFKLLCITSGRDDGAISITTGN